MWENNEFTRYLAKTGLSISGFILMVEQMTLVKLPYGTVHNWVEMKELPQTLVALVRLIDSSNTS